MNACERGHTQRKGKLAIRSERELSARELEDAGEELGALRAEHDALGYRPGAKRRAYAVELSDDLERFRMISHTLGLRFSGSGGPSAGHTSSARGKKRLGVAPDARPLAGETEVRTLEEINRDMQGLDRVFLGAVGSPVQSSEMCT